MQEKELAERAKLQEEERRMAREKEQSERQYKEFLASSFVNRIKQLWSLQEKRQLRWSFASIVKCSIHLRTDELKASSSPSAVA